MDYREEKKDSKKYKEQYLNGIEKLVKKREAEFLNERKNYSRIVLEEPDKYREEFKNMLGWPLNEDNLKGVRKVICDQLLESDQYLVRRMQFELFEDFSITGVLIKHSDNEKRPFVVVQHGGQGTPELVAGIHGDTVNYNNMAKRIFEAGANVFLPQLLMWDQQEYEVNYDRLRIDARLKKVGSSITALEIYSIMKVLDYFQEQNWVGNIGMAGLSYGGYYTLFTAAIDKRIKAAISSAFFCKGTYYIFPDWAFRDMEKLWGEAEISCLVYPRKLFLEMGNADELFDSNESREEYERIREICNKESDLWIELNVFDGEHEFCKDNSFVEKMVNSLKE